MIEFMKVLSLAHECVFEPADKNEESFYIGPSPDEVELVEFAKKMQFKFLEEKNSLISL